MSTQQAEKPAGQPYREPEHHGEEHIDLPEAPTPKPGTLAKIIVGVVAVLAVGFVVGLIPKLRQHSALSEEAGQRATARLRVQVAHPKLSDKAVKTTLPGTVSALREAVIYARTSGYLKQRNVDIGDKVKTGQLLALLETPEIDEQIGQARATLDQSKAAREQVKTNLEFARISLERIRPLTPAGVASRQDLDQREAAHQAEQANLRAAEAAIAANEANVRRLVELENFSRVVAPFDGTITARNVDVGALITAGNGTGQALFTLAASDPVRVFVSVPQNLSSTIHAGDAATLQVRDYPGKKFVGKITRDAAAIDIRSRTLLTEVQIPNKDGALLPGMYANVTFEATQPHPSLILDVSSLIQTSDGSAVAILDKNDKLHIQPIEIEQDFGAKLAVSGGVTAADRVVLNANGDLREGLAVEAIDTPAK
jgi:RND family efflux transporter MFP subunit